VVAFANQKSVFESPEHAAANNRLYTSDACIQMFRFERYEGTVVYGCNSCAILCFSVGLPNVRKGCEMKVLHSSAQTALLILSFG
jgi:hypothetical protein